MTLDELRQEVREAWNEGYDTLASVFLEHDGKKYPKFEILRSGEGMDAVIRWSDGSVVEKLRFKADMTDAAVEMLHITLTTPLPDGMKICLVCRERETYW